ncbi:MAG: alpha/beta hydrolase [Rhodocyclaceae bacterium]|nr:alpha/beta hydrolase [Rhodocyclaceae bacterium]
MNQTRLRVAGVDVFIDGAGSETLLMIHGWPDSYRLWDNTVAALSSQYRCVRFTLPGFDIYKPPQANSLTELTEMIRQIADAVSPGEKLTLVLHDWGCIFGYEFAARHPERVQRIAAVDIGDYNSEACSRSLSFAAKLKIFGYQFWLAISWKLGIAGMERVGNWMVRKMAQAMRCRADPAGICWQMNFPYAMRWFGLKGGLKQAAQVVFACPLLYIYAERKPFMFHSPEWLAHLAKQPGCEAHGFATGHWVMVEQTGLFNARLLAWLNHK